VSRALRLLHGEPEQSIEHLSERLGVSDRYLRKLFQQHVGMSPKQYQLAQRLLFAKSLLHQTSLSIENVAISSGFNSSRRLQDNFLKHFNLQPNKIRTNQVAREVTHTLNIFLPYRAPYNFDYVRNFLKVRQIEGIEEITENAYGRRFTWQGVKGEFCATVNIEQQGFDVAIKLDDLSFLYQVIQNIKRVLDLDLDSTSITEQLKTSGVDEDSIVQGIRLPGVWSLFEAGCRAILGQQISIKAAITHLNEVVRRINIAKGREEFVFPSPEEIASFDLSFLKMPNRRKETLKAFAQYVADNPNADAEDWLSIKGVGPWTVAYAKMRGNSDPDIWLGSDLVIKKAMALQNINPDNSKPWRSYLTFQMWSTM